MPTIERLISQIWGKLPDTILVGHFLYLPVYTWTIGHYKRFQDSCHSNRANAFKFHSICALITLLQTDKSKLLINKQEISNLGAFECKHSPTDNHPYRVNIKCYTAFSQPGGRAALSRPDNLVPFE